MSKSTKKRYIKSEAVKKLEQWAFDRKVKANPSFPYPVKPKYRDDTSNGLTKCVIDAIRFSGYQAERINSTGRPIIKTAHVMRSSLGVANATHQGKWIKGSSQNGTADISATIKGRSVKIEIKCKGSGDHYQSEDQRKYQAEVERAGGVYIIVRDFEGFVSWFKGFLNGR